MIAVDWGHNQERELFGKMILPKSNLGSILDIIHSVDLPLHPRTVT